VHGIGPRAGHAGTRDGCRQRRRAGDSPVHSAAAEFEWDGSAHARCAPSDCGTCGFRQPERCTGNAFPVLDRARDTSGAGPYDTLRATRNDESAT
jgi:hypothetical protein